MADKRLLIVDDNKLYRDSMVYAFKNYFEIDACGSLEQAEAFIQKHHYNLVITDGAFPEKGSSELLETTDSDYNGSILAKIAKARGIIVIGMSSEPKKLKNCDYTFQKPIDLVEMINFIKKELKMI